MVEIEHGNIILFAGTPNAGKTAFMLNIIRENMRDWDVHYFNSEMGGSELKKRIKKFNDISPDMWDMNVYGYSGDYSDHIKTGKNSLNIID